MGGGREVQEGGDMYTPMADFMLLYGRNQHNIVKQLSSNKKFKTKKEYWNKLPFPLPWDLPNPGTEPVSLASPALAGRFFTIGATCEAPKTCMQKVINFAERNFKRPK